MAPFGATAAGALVAVALSGQGDGLPTTAALGALLCLTMALATVTVAVVSGRSWPLVATVAALFLATTWLWIDVGDAREPVACPDDQTRACSFEARSARATVGAVAPVGGAVLVVGASALAPRRREPRLRS